MSNQALILVVDDMPDNIDIVRARLESLGYRVISAVNGLEALERARVDKPDLILLDVMMPKLDGVETVKRLKAETNLPFIPVVMLTAKADPREVVAGLDAGADDYLTKPIDHAALVARVRSMLRVKALHTQLERQAATLRDQAKELAGWNARLEQRVADQVVEIERVGRLKRFLSPQIVDVIVSAGDDEGLLRSHRREVVVLFCDLRGFTAFAETAEPEEVIALLRDYHAVLGPLVRHFEGTLDHFAGDGVMVFFNDPVPCDDAPLRAIRLADAIRRDVGELTDRWTRAGHPISFGVGISQGFATLGQVGFEHRRDYAAIGTVTNVASRLCSEAKDGQVLVTGKVALATAAEADYEPFGEAALKGLSRPIQLQQLGRIKDRVGADERERMAGLEALSGRKR